MSKRTPREWFWARWGGGKGEGKLEETQNSKLQVVEFKVSHAVVTPRGRRICQTNKSFISKYKWHVCLSSYKKCKVVLGYASVCGMGRWWVGRREKRDARLTKRDEK